MVDVGTEVRVVDLAVGAPVLLNELVQLVVVEVELKSAQACSELH